MRNLCRITTLLALFGLLSGGALWAQKQAPSQKELEEKRDQKLAKGFLKKARWITDYDKARAQAQKSGKLIFAYFTRSYAY